MAIPSVPAQFGLWGPALLALTLAALGAWLTRRRQGWAAPVGAAAAAAGWAMLLPTGWRGAVWPRAEPEWFVMPALVMAASAAATTRLPSRWWTVAAVCFGGWWLASSPAGRAEFWRVEAGAVAAAWVLTRMGAERPPRGLVVAAALLGAVWVGGAAPVWVSAALVLAAVCAGLATAGRAATIQPGLLMLGLLGAELGAGRALRGGLGTVDLACLGALVAPAALPAVEKRLRRLGRAASAGSALAVVAAVVGAAWLAARAMH